MNKERIVLESRIEGLINQVIGYVSVMKDRPSLKAIVNELDILMKRRDELSELHKNTTGEQDG